MAKKIEPSELLNDLAHFTGTVNWYRNPIFPNFLYTDGIKHLAEQAGAYWLIDFIFSNQISPVKEQPFQVWKIKVIEDKGFISVEDGNDNVIEEYEIPYTDFPLSEYSVWLTDRVLMLKSEY